MNCKKCGNLLAPTDVVCPMCGEPVNANPLPQTPVEPTPVSVNPSPITNEVPVGQPSVEPSTPNIPKIVLPTEPAPAPAPTPMEAPVTPVTPVVPNQTEAPLPTPEPVGPVPVNPAPMNNPVNPSPVEPTAAPAPNNQMPPQEQPKKNSTATIIIVVLLVAAIALGGLFVWKKFFQDNTNVNTNNNIIDNGGNNGQEVNPVNNGGTSSNTFEYKSFELPLPNNYQAEINQNGKLDMWSVTDKVEVISSFIAGFTTDDIVGEAEEEVKNGIISKGSAVTSVERKTYNGVSWVIFNTTDVIEGKTYNTVRGLCSLGSYNIAYNNIFNFGTKSYDSILTELSNMYLNTTYRGSTQFSSTDEKESLDDRVEEPNNASSLIEENNE